LARAASDLDEAVQSDPQNVQAWITRGLAYEQLGEKNKAAGSYGRAINLRPSDEAARTGLPASAANPARTTIRSEDAVPIASRAIRPSAIRVSL